MRSTARPGKERALDGHFRFRSFFTYRKRPCEARTESRGRNPFFSKSVEGFLSSPTYGKQLCSPKHLTSNFTIFALTNAHSYGMFVISSIAAERWTCTLLAERIPTLLGGKGI